MFNNQQGTLLIRSAVKENEINEIIKCINRKRRLFFLIKGNAHAVCDLFHTTNIFNYDFYSVIARARISIVHKIINCEIKCNLIGNMTKVQ